MRIALALRAFFAVLFGKRLPLALIPTELIPDPTDDILIEEMARAGLIKERKGLPARSESADATSGEKKSADAPNDIPMMEAVAAQTLGLLQAEGRLLDFLSEDIADYPDADVGQVVREVHRGCKKAIDDHFTLEPIRTEEEDTTVTIADGFDPGEIRLVGQVVGSPPFKGTLKHPGYRAQTVRLPRIRTGGSARVIVPAEIEV